MRLSIAIDTTLLVLAGLVSAHSSRRHVKTYLHAKRDLPALDPTPRNSIPNNGGPIIPYNGSGDVPEYDQMGPPPKAFTPFEGKNSDRRDFKGQLSEINRGPGSDCEKCTNSVQLFREAAVSRSVDDVVDLLIQWCQLLPDFELYAASCHSAFAIKAENATEFSAGKSNIGAYLTQLFSKMQSENDKLYFCSYYNWKDGRCPAPAPEKIDESQFFGEKPPSANIAPEPSGKTFDVLHITDWHLDPRYAIGSESACAQYQCCRPNKYSKASGKPGGKISQPASRYGSRKCNTPADLAISTFTTMDQFFDRSNVEFAIFTGDVVSHDDYDELSQEYIEYEERATYLTFKAHMGDTPVYATPGNHDSAPEAYAAPDSLTEGTGYNEGNSFSWNWELHSQLWGDNGWITEQEADFARTHYGAYAHTTKRGLRIISINSDFWYRDNMLNFYDTLNPDNSGVLAFLASELTDCEERDQRAWIIAHVPTGYDGTQALPTPSALFHSIVARFSPRTIAAIFFGHTHEDQVQIFYDFAGNSLDGSIRDTTLIDTTKPLQMGYIGPSITPLPGLNAGYHRLQVDAETFSVMGYQTYIANISESLQWTTPEWKFEYDARETYNVGSVDWPEEAPLNATFYDKVTAEMAGNGDLVNQYVVLGHKSVTGGATCKTAACQKEKICFIKASNANAGLDCKRNPPTS